MKTTLLASVAILFLGVSASQSAVPTLDGSTGFAALAHADMLQLASNSGSGGDGGGNSGSGGNGGGNSGSGGNGGDDSDGDDHGGNGGHHGAGHDDNDDSSISSSDDDSLASGSKRRKPRVPGGSGCDGAGDAAEHAGC